MGQTTGAEDQIIIPPFLRQGDKGKAPQLVAGSQAQQHLTPAQQRQGHQRKKVAPKRQFTKINMSLGQVLQRMLQAGLITLRVPHPNPNTSAPTYHSNRRCAYHSYGPGHDTEDCWALKNKTQDLIDNGVLRFMPNGEMKIFR